MSKKKKRASGKMEVRKDRSGPSKSNYGTGFTELTKKNPSVRTKHFRYYLAALVSLLTFLIYLKSLENEFVNWDDDVYVYENSLIRSFDAQFLKSAFGGFHVGFWHPLTLVSHALDYALWGLNPLGHHLTNNILHALSTFIVVLVVIGLMEVFKKTSESKGLSQPFLNDRTTRIVGAVTGLLFGLHPLHVESVAWVADRKDLLCAVFFLLSITTYTNYVRENAEKAFVDSASRFFNKKYLLTLGFFILALLSKPIAVTLPFVLLILDWYPFRRIRSLKTFWTAFIEKLPFLVLALISSILTILAEEAVGAIRSVEVVPLASRVIVAAKSLIAYLVKMVLPLNLVPFYPYPSDVSLFSFENIISIVIVIAITATCIAIMRRQKLWISAWSYYVIVLPVLGIIQVGGHSMADRYTYLPSLGPFLIIGLIAAKVYEKVSALSRWGVMLKMASFFIAMIMLVSLSYATFKQMGIWRNSFVLWNYVIEKEPERVPLAHNNLGFEYYSKGILDKAIEQYQTALRLKSDYAEAHNNLGAAYQSKGLLDDAIEHHQTALRLKPDYTEAHNNLAVAYASKGLLDKAIEQYQTALRLKPDFAEAQNNLGLAYSSKGLIDRAIEQYQTALRLKPDYAAAHYNLGRRYLDKGSKDMARTEFELVLKIKPDASEVRQILNSILSK